MNLANDYFPQDSATARATRATNNDLEKFSGGLIVGWWPSPSPDLLLDFFSFFFLRR
jgi:hypothetical protein